MKARSMRADEKIKEAMDNLSHAVRSRSAASLKKYIDYWEKEIPKAIKEQAAARKAMRKYILKSRTLEMKKMVSVERIPKIETEEGEMDLKGAMQFFARLVDIFDPQAGTLLERDALVTVPLRMEKQDATRVGEWFYASLANDCAEEVVYAIEERELGITISKNWANRKRRMAYGGIQMEKRIWGRGHRAKFGRLRGRGLYTPLKIEHERFKFEEGSVERAQGLLKVELNRPGQVTTIKAIKPDHPLIWTGTLISNIEGWSDYSERAAYYGIRRKGEMHPYPENNASKKDIVDIAGILMHRYNFLARPAVKRRVRMAAYHRIMELINILVG